MGPILKNEYWSLSRKPIFGLMFVLPLWLIYELLAFQINQSWQGNLRTGTDLLFKGIFEFLGVPEWNAVVLPSLFLILYLLDQRKRILKTGIKPVHFAYMFLESLFYALLFGIVVGGFTGFFLVQQKVHMNQSLVNLLVVHLGAGVYEEFFFRLLFISGTVIFFRKAFNKELSTSYPVAILLGSLLFACFHYLEIFDQPFHLDSFLFRLFAGVVFSFLFIFRGYGICAYTHSLYNVLLLFR